MQRKNFPVPGFDKENKFILIKKSQYSLVLRVIVLGIIMREIFVFGKEYNCETNVDKLHNVIMV